jgi:carbonic anhydrase
MQSLLRGVREFRAHHFESRRPLFEELARGQWPQTLFITCSDSRIDPNLLTQAAPGELFVLRTAGNVVPPYSLGPGGEAATIEYAVAYLKVRDVIVCGHSHCGAVEGLLRPERLVGLPTVTAYLARSEATRPIVEDDQPNLDPGSSLDAAIRRHVLAQVENLRTHPAVAAAVARGDLRLHGWVYVFETGEVLGYDATADRFHPIGADDAPEG